MWFAATCSGTFGDYRATGVSGSEPCVGNFAVYTDEVPTIGLKKGVVYFKTQGDGGVDLAMPLDIFFAFAVEIRVFRQSLQDARTEPADIFRNGRRKKS